MWEETLEKCVQLQVSACEKGHVMKKNLTRPIELSYNRMLNIGQYLFNEDSLFVTLGSIVDLFNIVNT